MTRIDLHESSKLTFAEGAAPSTPASGKVLIYAKADGLLYSKDDAGTETGLAGGGAVTDILDIPTAETDDALVLAPDGAGGVEFRAEAGGGISPGTAFPGGPSAGDLFHRTDLSPAFWRYDGTRWLCTCPHLVTSGPTEELWPVTTTSRRQRFLVPYKGTFGLYLRTFWFSTLVTVTNDGSRYWTITLYRHDSADNTVSLGAVDTSADSPNVWVAHPIAVNAVLDSGAFLMGSQFVKTSTPGALYPTGALDFSLIAT